MLPRRRLPPFPPADQCMPGYEKNSLTLFGAVAMGTGVMIGAGVFALTGQLAQQAGGLFPFAFVAAAVVAGFSAYSYVLVCNDSPSAGGVAMILKRCYGGEPGTRGAVVTAGMSLLMYFSMVINESLVARTFGTYMVQAFRGPEADAEGGGGVDWLIPALGVGLVAFAFLMNLAGNKAVSGFQKPAAIVKVLGVAVFAIVGLWVSGLSFESVGPPEGEDAGVVSTVGGFLAATALGLLAYKGFTTITNDGDELQDPKKNVGRAIVISLVVCAVLYTLVAFAVAAGLSVEEVVEARDYALAEAARPAVGEWGVWFTVAIAIVATASGIVASVFAVSRMLAMLTEMELVPHRSFGMPGGLQKHTLVYTVVLAAALTVFLDLGRIATLGAFFYIVMDMAIHWGLLRRLKDELKPRTWVLLIALGLDAAILAALVWVKAESDPLVLVVSAVGFALVFGGSWWFLRRHDGDDGEEPAAEG